MRLFRRRMRRVIWLFRCRMHLVNGCFGAGSGCRGADCEGIGARATTDIDRCFGRSRTCADGT
eukprot:3393569-Lingulodinium_polyedra.AAC.1